MVDYLAVKMALMMADYLAFLMVDYLVVMRVVSMDDYLVAMKADMWEKMLDIVLVRVLDLQLGLM